MSLGLCSSAGSSLQGKKLKTVDVKAKEADSFQSVVDFRFKEVIVIHRIEVSS